MPSTRNKLNDKQIRLLKLIYKFRFVTTELLARRLGLTKRTINKSLSILLDREYIARRYEKRYNILGKPASYYLAPKGIRLLRDEYGLNKQSLNARFYDYKRTDRFIDNTIKIFAVYLRIKEQHPDEFIILNKPELFALSEQRDSLFIEKQLPDMFMQRKHPKQDKSNEYIVEVLDNTAPIWVHQKLIDSYVKHFDEEFIENAVYPAILLICEFENFKSKLQRHVSISRDRALIDEEDLQIRIIHPKKIIDELA